MAYDRSPEHDAMILAAYDRLKNGTKVAKELGFNDRTVYRVLAKNGFDGGTAKIEFYGRLRKFTDADVGKVVDAYKSGVSATAIAKENDCAVWTVLEALKRAGVEIRDKPRMTRVEREEVKSLYEGGLNFKEVAEKTGRHVNTIMAMMNKNYSDVVRSDMVGPGGPHWKGGRTKSQGYSQVWIADDDPLVSMRGSGSYALEHRIVMARKLKRLLLDSETVHHIDGNRENNDLANLQLRQGKHGKHTVMYCMTCGSLHIGHKQLDV